MSKGVGTARLLPMSDEARGAELKRRAKALGITYARELERALDDVDRKVPRASISKAWAGKASPGIYDKLESAMDHLEESWSPPEGGGALADEGVIRFTLHNVYGVGEVIAEGPPENREELVELLAKLLRDLRAEEG